MKPTFVVIGATKCATSSLRWCLGLHPEVFLLDRAEPTFFARDDRWQRGSSWYESLFAGALGKTAVGEGSNGYSMKEIYPDSARRMESVLPQAKLLYAVRDPLERIESLWMQHRSHGGERVHWDLNKAVHLNWDILVASSNYWRQISSYRDYYRDDQILIVFYEDFRADPDAVLRQCFDFLGVDPSFTTEASSRPFNVSMGKTLVRPFKSKLRSRKWYPYVRDLIPSSLRSAINRSVLTTRVTKRPVWRADSRCWVLEQLRDDSVRLLRHCGKPLDYWHLK